MSLIVRAVEPNWSASHKSNANTKLAIASVSVGLLDRFIDEITDNDYRNGRHDYKQRKMAVGSMSVPEGQHATDHAQQICAQKGGNSNECSHMRCNIDCSP